MASDEKQLSPFRNYTLYVNNSDQPYYDHGDVDDFELMFHTVLYKRTAPILFGLITGIGLFGNCLVILVILLNRHMRSTINMALLNLAFCDVTFLTVCVPFVAYHYAADNWGIGEPICKLSQYILFVTMYVTVYTLVLVSALRYFTVVHGNATYKLRTRRNICIMIASMWVVALTLNIPILFIYEVKVFPMYPPYYYCGMTSQAVGQRLFLSFFILDYVLPLLAIGTLYVLILRYLCKKRQQSFRIGVRNNNGSIPSSDHTTYATRIVVIVVAVFGACWLPLHVHLLVAYFGHQPATYSYQVFRMFCHVIAYSNSCLNPLIYSYASKDFRNAFSNLCHCQINRRPQVCRGPLSNRSSNHRQAYELNSQTNFMDVQPSQV